MTAFRSSYCRRCDLLDGNAFARTCTACRTTDEHEADRLSRIDARKERERITDAMLAARWHTPVGRTISASVAISLMTAGQAQAADLPPPEVAPFIAIIVLCAIMIAALVGMIWPWPFRRPVGADPHAAPFGDVLTLPGRGE